MEGNIVCGITMAVFCLNYCLENQQTNQKGNTNPERVKSYTEEAGWWSVLSHGHKLVAKIGGDSNTQDYYRFCFQTPFTIFINNPPLGLSSSESQRTTFHSLTRTPFYCPWFYPLAPSALTTFENLQELWAGSHRPGVFYLHS